MNLSRDWTHLLVRIFWAVNFGLVWVGLLPRGWYRTTFTGSPDYGKPAYAENYKAQYGLFSADFTDRSGQDYVVGYEEWAKAARDPNAFLRVHGAQVAGVIAAAASILTFVAYFRTVCSKVETRIFTTKRAFMLSLLDLALTLTAVVLWAMLINNPAMAVMCTYAGCFSLPVQGMTFSTISYSWGLWLVRALFQVVVVVCLARIARETTVEFSSPSSIAKTATPKSGSTVASDVEAASGKPSAPPAASSSPNTKDSPDRPASKSKSVPAWLQG